MVDKEKRFLKELSSQIWSESSVNLPLNDDLSSAISKLKIINCSETTDLLADLKKFKNYDYFLIIKFGNSHYFFDTSRLSELKELKVYSNSLIISPPLIEVENYNVFLRKTKLKKLKDNE